jgi:hypothetical protein
MLRVVRVYAFQSSEVHEMKRHHKLPPVCAAMLLAAGAGAVYAQACSVESGAQAPVVVELYTSEGCNSCPPADRWLSTLKDKPGVLAAAFHVDYWDRLGWKDRFASPRFTERQAQVQAAAGARYSYTPQVRVNGSDWRRWPELPSVAGPAPVYLALQRDGDQVDVKVEPTSDTGRRWALWWARQRCQGRREHRRALAPRPRGAPLRQHRAVERATGAARRGARPRRRRSRLARDHGRHRCGQRRDRAGRAAALWGLKKPQANRLRPHAADRSPSRRS